MQCQWQLKAGAKKGPDFAQHPFFSVASPAMWPAPRPSSLPPPSHDEQGCRRGAGPVPHGTHKHMQQRLTRCLLHSPFHTHAHASKEGVSATKEGVRASKGRWRPTCHPPRLVLLPPLLQPRRHLLRLPRHVFVVHCDLHDAARGVRRWGEGGRAQGHAEGRLWGGQGKG